LFSPSEFGVVARAFAETVRRHRYTCYACAIMPDHIHLLIRKHSHLAEDMIEHFQNESRPLLVHAGVRSTDHPTWGGPGWNFLDHPDDIWRTIRYIEGNPIKARLPRQNRDFVTRYDDWPLRRKTPNRS
jgi:REP element-mobilizing transposase RayT